MRGLFGGVIVFAHLQNGGSNSGRNRSGFITPRGGMEVNILW